MWASMRLGFVLTLFLAWDARSQESRVSLQTPQGIIIGTRETVPRDRSSAGLTYYAFRGIQYAKAERWEEPELVEPTGENVQATGYKTQCSQWSVAGNRVVGSEECLFLNIFTPNVPNSGVRGTSRPLLPVMIYFHSGSFMYGSSDSAGPRRFMRNDNVILVTVSYRLGVFGYLSTGDHAIGGNFGGLDQIAALQWVQKHIRNFGGNPQRVTIFGNGAGAASVHLLMLSPKALGLFHGAIIQSGSALCEWAIESNPAEYAMQLGESIGCSGGSEELATCLKEKTPDELIDAQQKLLDLYVFPIRTAPVVDVAWRGDEGFLPGLPEELMDAGAFAQVPVMTGVVQDEGLMGYAAIHEAVGNDNFKNAEYFENELIPNLLKAVLDDDREIEVVTNAVKAQYFQGIDFENETKLAISELVELIGDVASYSCHWETLEKLASDSKSPVYSYVFTHKTPRSPTIMSKLTENLRRMGVHHTLIDYGVSQSDELFYLFDPFTLYPGNVNQRLSAVDEAVSDTMIKTWVSFATTGSPTNGLSLIPNSTPWRPVRPGNINYYNITSISAPMGQDFRKGEALFWLRTVPYIQELGQEISDLEVYPTLFWVFLGLFILFLIVSIVLAIVLWRKRTSQKVNL